MEKHKKVVIIGSGIGGLTAGIYAAQAGFETVIYEQHNIVGGECTGWDRQGYHIDNCIHWMVGTTPGTELNKIWLTVGAIGDNIEMKRQKAMYTSELNGERLTLWQDIDRTEQEMIRLSPEDTAEVKDLIEVCKVAQKVQIPAKVPSELMGIKDRIWMLWNMREGLKLFKKYAGMDTLDLMNRFKHPLIRNLISDFCPKESQATSFPMAYGNFISGDGGIPEGGSRAMAFRMRKKFESYGGKVAAGKAVKKIEVSGNKAVAILLEDGSEVAGDYMIPACDLSVTFGTLLPKNYMSSLFQEMYEDRKAYPVYNTFQVALAVDSVEAVMEEELIIDAPELVFTEGMSDRITIKMYSYEPSFAPQGKQIIQTLQGGAESVYTYWKDIYKNKETYKKVKNQIAQQTLEVIEKRFPMYKGKLKVLDAWTPMTYSRYCSAYKGFYQSFQITKHSRKTPYPSAYIEGLDNVILAGQWINPPGGLPGAAITGKFAVQRILKKENRPYNI